jgi:hypothetical protein
MKGPMDQNRVELFKIVADDLEYLHTEWNSDPSDTTLRHGSVALRRLLLENQIQTAWRDSGILGRITIPAPNLDKLINSDRGVVAGFAGGAHFKDVYAKLGIIRDESIQSRLPSREPKDEQYRLNKFLEATGLYFARRRIKRREVISYVANKLGGAHLDFDRDSESFKALASAEIQFQLMGKDAVFF